MSVFFELNEGETKIPAGISKLPAFCALISDKRASKLSNRDAVHNVFLFSWGEGGLEFFKVSIVFPFPLESE